MYAEDETDICSHRKQQTGCTADFCGEHFRINLGQGRGLPEFGVDGYESAGFSGLQQCGQDLQRVQCHLLGSAIRPVLCDGLSHLCRAYAPGVAAVGSSLGQFHRLLLSFRGIGEKQNFAAEAVRIRQAKDTLCAVNCKGSNGV